MSNIREKTKKTVKSIDMNGYRGFDYTNSAVNPDSTPFFGVEIEVEQKDLTSLFSLCQIDYDFYNDLSDKESEIGYRFLDSVYEIKFDDSLDNGIELIFNPMTIEYIRYSDNGIANIFNWLVKQDFISQKPTCGMHIHINKSAFHNDNHMNDFLRFIHFNKHALLRLSGRLSYAQINEYARFMSINSIKYGIIPKYNAVNTYKENTLEVRFFQSTLDIDIFKYNIEIINAIFEYTKSINLFTDYTIEYIEPEQVYKYGFKRFLNWLKPANPDLYLYIDNKIFSMLDYIEISEPLSLYPWQYHLSRMLYKVQCNSIIRNLVVTVSKFARFYLDLYYCFNIDIPKNEVITEFPDLDGSIKTFIEEIRSEGYSFDKEIAKVLAIRLSAVNDYDCIFDDTILRILDILD